MRQRIQALRDNSEGGFTLVELLVVVVILGVLSGIVVFAVANFNSEGVLAACKANVKNVEVASEAYYAKNGSYAATTADLVNAGYLREAPNPGGKYTFNYANGVVTATYNNTSCVTQ